LKSLSIDRGASLAPFVDKRLRWGTYGSSVTQCSVSKSPVHTWPAVVARICNFNLLNLGFSGECCLDAMVARVIRETPLDFISMEIGPNIYGYNALNERSFRAAVLAFVKLVREGHPKTPYVLMSPIYYPVGEKKKNNAGFTMQMMRRELAAAAATIRAGGDKNFHFVDGMRVLGPRHSKLLPDGCHPTPEGYIIMGQNFSRVVARKYFKRASRR
jgi:lysophospholipase L1-like esterase